MNEMGHGNPAVSLTHSMGMTMRVTEIIHIDKRCAQINWGTTTAHTLRSMSSNAHYQRWRVAYLLGHKQPRFPVPATQDNALTANWHDLWCKCSMCIADWLDRREIS